MAGVVIISLIFTVVDIAYFAYLNGSERGQTLGQMMLGIAVRDETSGGAIGPPVVRPCASSSSSRASS